MAVPGLVETMLGGLEATTRKVLSEIFRYTLPNGRLGPVEHQTKSENLQAYHVVSTTASSTGEFSVVHGMGRIPYLASPTLDLTAIGAQLVPLEVTRSADAQRLYLKSTSTAAVFSLIVE